MTAALTETFESLHIAAARKLLQLLETEKDPNLLARLIATAFRYKLPKPAAQPPSPPAGDAPDPPAEAPAPPRHYTQEEYAELIRRHGSAEAMDMRRNRDALVALYNRRRGGAATPG